MANRTLTLDERTMAYVIAMNGESPALCALREETASHPTARMQIAPEQGAFMAWLVRTLGARRGIEVGTYTGYSALAVVSALPPDGWLVCCDINQETSAIAVRHWEAAGVRKKIDLRIAPAIESLTALRAEGGDGTYDFVFIDADKPSYDAYYETSLALLRPGGVILIDNVLWSGLVADPNDRSESTLALRALNEKVRTDPRVDATLVPVGDGLTLARKL